MLTDDEEAKFRQMVDELRADSGHSPLTGRWWFAGVAAAVFAAVLLLAVHPLASFAAWVIGLVCLHRAVSAIGVTGRWFNDLRSRWSRP